VSGTLTAGPLVPSGTVNVSLGGSTVGAAIGGDGSFTATLPTGTLAVAGSPYPIAYIYNGDPNFNPAGGASSLTVVDTTAPSITAVTTTPGTLGVPNHKMVDVLVAYGATDFSGTPVCSVSVSSNEPINASDDGNTGIDWLVIDPHHVQLRAERSGIGAGRVYSIAVRCTDASGNASTAGGAVSVPR
jgi:hypothetical protein